MSKYTTMLRWVVEQELDDKKLEHTEDNWESVYGKLGIDDYPIFDETHRKTLNDKIIRHYYFREIGFETAELFRWYMRSKMHEIMPYYNKLYESELFEIDPLKSFSGSYSEIWEDERNITTHDERETDRNDETQAGSSTSSTTNNRNVFEDTPQSLLDNSSAPTVQGLDYATNVTYDDESTSSETESSSSTTVHDETAADGTSKNLGDGTKTRTESGYKKSQSELLLEYRKTLLNIDMMVIEELQGLFFGLW